MPSAPPRRSVFDATRTLVLRYRARNGLRFFEDHDELYWIVTGDEWDVPVGAASARIELPRSTARTIRRRRSMEIGAGMVTSRLVSTVIVESQVSIPRNRNML